MHAFYTHKIKKKIENTFYIPSNPFPYIRKLALRARFVNLLLDPGGRVLGLGRNFCHNRSGGCAATNYFINEVKFLPRGPANPAKPGRAACFPHLIECHMFVCLSVNFSHKLNSLPQKMSIEKFGASETRTSDLQV